MAKLESSLKNMILSLSIISLVSSALLAGVYTITKEPIELAQIKKQADAIKEVLPETTDLIEQEVEIKLEGRDIPFYIYPARENGELIGAAIKTYSNEGYAGMIEVMVGINNKGEIFNYTILAASETPGLGSKIAQWFKADKETQTIIGKSPENTNFTVSKDGGDIDAITASTISSRAFLSSIRDAYQAYKTYEQNTISHE